MVRFFILCLVLTAPAPAGTAPAEWSDTPNSPGRPYRGQPGELKPTHHESEDAKFARFADAYFSLGLDRIATPPNTENYLRTRFFRLLLQGVDPTKLDLDNRIDCEILETRLESVLDGWSLHRPDAHPPVWALPPKDFLKQLGLLGSPSSWPAQIDLSFALLKSAENITLEYEGLNREATAHIDALFKEVDAFAIAALAARADSLKPVLSRLHDVREKLKEYREKIASHKAEGRAPPKREPTKRERYQYALKYSLFTDYTPDTLLDLAFAHYRDTEERLEACARRIDPSKSWRELIEECKSEAYAADEYFDAAGALARKARDFAIEKDLVTIPEGARSFDVRKGSKGEITPFGYYSPGGGRKKGAFVTAPLAGLDEAALRERLRDNNKYWVTIVSLHEAVPGHHLQFEVARGLKRSRIRELAGASTYIEGWGLYCEEMMFRNGYYRDGGKERLCALKMRLWRCARVIIDVGLQTGTLSKEEAVRLLAESVTLEPTSAALEVEHYSGRPTYFCGYLLGFLAITDLRALAEKELGAKFDQKKFHDAILRLGPMPLRELHLAIRAWVETQK